jgi:hypothetical protein
MSVAPNDEMLMHGDVLAAIAIAPAKVTKMYPCAEPLTTFVPYCLTQRDRPRRGTSGDFLRNPRRTASQTEG